MALIVAALIFGFMTGRSGRPTGHSGQKTNQASTSPEQNRRQSPTGSSLPNISTVSATAIFEGRRHLEEQLQELLKGSMNQQKIVRLHTLLSATPTTDYPLVLDFFNKVIEERGTVGGYQRHLFNQAIEIMAEKDSGVMMAFAENTENKTQRQNYLQFALKGWSMSDPLGARQWVDQLESGMFKARMTQHVALGLARHSLKEALLFIDSNMKGPMAVSAKQGVLYEIAEEHPEEAALQLSSMPHNRMNEYYFQRIATIWAQEDRAKSLAWAQSIEKTSTRNNVLAGIAQTMSVNEAEDFQSLLGNISHSQQKREAIGQFARANAQDNLQGTLNWIENLVDTDDQSQAY